MESLVLDALEICIVHFPTADRLPTYLFWPLFRSSNTHFTSLHPCSLPKHCGPHLTPQYASSPRIAVPSTRSPHTYQGSKWTGAASPHSTPPSTTPRPASSRDLGTEFRGQYGLIFIAGINILHLTIDSVSSFILVCISFLSCFGREAVKCGALGTRLPRSACNCESHRSRVRIA